MSKNDAETNNEVTSETSSIWKSHVWMAWALG